MADKIHTQKAYEKMAMVMENSDKLTLAYAKDELDQDCLVLMVDTTPIARILQEPNGYEPDFEMTAKLKPLWEELKHMDNRVTQNDFDRDRPEITAHIDKFLTKLGK